MYVRIEGCRDPGSTQETVPEHYRVASRAHPLEDIRKNDQIAQGNDSSSLCKEESDGPIKEPVVDINNERGYVKTILDIKRA